MQYTQEVILQIRKVTKRHWKNFLNFALKKNKMKTVLNKKISLTPKDTKTNIEIPFDIEENADKLKISFKYLPKILEDEEKAKQLVKDCILKHTGIFTAQKPCNNQRIFSR